MSERTCEEKIEWVRENMSSGDPRELLRAMDTICDGAWDPTTKAMPTPTPTKAIMDLWITREMNDGLDVSLKYEPGPDCICCRADTHYGQKATPTPTDAVGWATLTATGIWTDDMGREYPDDATQECRISASNDPSRLDTVRPHIPTPTPTSMWFEDARPQLDEGVYLQDFSGRVYAPGAQCVVVSTPEPTKPMPFLDDYWCGLVVGILLATIAIGLGAWMGFRFRKGREETG